MKALIVGVIETILHTTRNIQIKTTTKIRDVHAFTIENIPCVRPTKENNITRVIPKNFLFSLVIFFRLFRGSHLKKLAE